MSSMAAMGTNVTMSTPARIPFDVDDFVPGSGPWARATGKRTRKDPSERMQDSIDHFLSPIVVKFGNIDTL